MTLTGRGIQLHALLQLRDGAVLLAAVPERHAEMVVRLRRGRLQRDRPFQLTDGSREVSLLPQREAEQRVRLCILVVELQRLFETLPRARDRLPCASASCACRYRSFAGFVEEASAVEGLVDALADVERAFCAARLCCFSALPKRVIPLAHFRIDLERALVGRDRRR